MLRTLTSARRRGPPRTRVGTREHTYATPRSAVGVCDHSHAHGSRTRTAPDHISHQPVTGQRSTALTVIFSRQPPSRLGQPTEPQGGHTRSLLRTAVGHCSLDHAHHPHGVGAGAGCALSRPSWAAALAQRPRSCDNQGRFPTAAHSVANGGQSMTAPRRLRVTMVVCRAGTR